MATELQFIKLTWAPERGADKEIKMGEGQPT